MRESAECLRLSAVGSKRYESCMVYSHKLQDEAQAGAKAVRHGCDVYEMRSQFTMHSSAWESDYFAPL